MNAHPSGYYEWLKAPNSQRDINDKKLTGRIKQSWLEIGGHYGYRGLPHQSCINWISRNQFNHEYSINLLTDEQLIYDNTVYTQVRLS